MEKGLWLILKSTGIKDSGKMEHLVERERRSMRTRVSLRGIFHLESRLAKETIAGIGMEASIQGTSIMGL